MSDDQFDSDEMPLLPPRKRLAPKWTLGLVAGVLAGPLWALAAGFFLFDSHEFRKPYFVSYLVAVPATMAAAGLIMGLVPRWPEVVGVFIGAGSTPALFMILGGKNLPPTFAILATLFMIPIGAVGAMITGLLLRLLARFTR